MASNSSLEKAASELESDDDYLSDLDELEEDEEEDIAAGSITKTGWMMKRT